MTITQAAAILGKSDMTLRRWIDAGYIQAIKIGKMWDIPQEEIDRLKAGAPNAAK